MNNLFPTVTMSKKQAKYCSYSSQEYACERTRALTMFGAITILLLFPSQVFAQDCTALFESIKATSTRNEPEWRISSSRVSTKSVSIRWSYADSYVQAYIAIYSSDDDASTRFTGLASELDMLLEGEGYRARLFSLADENFIWTDFNDAGSAAVHFKRKNIHVMVTAPSPETAERFSRLIAEHL